MLAADPPPPLMVSEVGSFAERTIVQRKPQIIADIIEQNDYPSEVVAGLHALAREIAGGTVVPLSEAPHLADVRYWHQAWRPWQGHPWRQLAWFFAETYFYRRVLEVVRYFESGSWHLHDPFESQKRQALAEGLQALATFYAPLPRGASLEDQFGLWLRRSLWGNRADLSNKTINPQADQELDDSSERLLIDHTQAVWQLLTADRVRRVDLVADNSGLELLSDLALLDLVLSRGLVDTAHLHLKRQPYFVSDAMVKDLMATLSALQHTPTCALAEMGKRLESERADGRLVVHDHPFWTTSLFFSQFPEDVRSSLAKSDLVIFKGDVNYRRLLEDRHWPPTSDLGAIAAYMPTSFAALRTLKGELIVGLQEGQAAELVSADPDWLINGERGVIHLVSRSQA